MCVCVYICVTKSAQGAGKLIFGVVVAHDRACTKCRNGVHDLDLDLVNEVKVRRSRNFISGNSQHRIKCLVF